MIIQWTQGIHLVVLIPAIYILDQYDSLSTFVHVRSIVRMEMRIGCCDFL